MNIKHSIYPFAVGLLLFGACEDDSRNGQADPVVYIVNNGFQTTTYYDIESELDYNVYVYNSGFSPEEADIRLVPAPEALEAYNLRSGQNYKLLDEEYYAFIRRSGSLNNRRSTLIVRMNCEAIRQLPDPQNYVIPLQITATGLPVNEKLSAILLNPLMQETEVRVKDTGVVESDLSSDNTLQFTAYTEFDNKWNSTFEYAHGTDVLAEYNRENGTSYLALPEDSYIFHPAELAAQTNEAVATIEIDKSKLQPDRYYALAVKLTGNSRFKIAADNTVLYHIRLLNTDLDTRRQWKFIECSSWSMSGGDHSPAMAIDGNASTFWENRWADAGSGDTNKLPVSATWDMGKRYYWCGVTISRRSDNYVSDLQKGEIQISDDGQTYEIAQTFDFGDNSNKAASQKFFIDNKKWPSGRYIRLVLTSSNRNVAVSVAEFEPIQAEIPE